MSTKDDIAALRKEVDDLKEDIALLRRITRLTRDNLFQFVFKAEDERTRTKSKASEQMRKIASLSYALAKEMEESS